MGRHTVGFVIRLAVTLTSATFLSALPAGTDVTNQGAGAFNVRQVPSDRDRALAPS
ncbi:hypothetical protein [Halomicronema sp. CCY15110]|uniref:hypothetical protein n=1 Tax=Halomicronema sp. CCY15110 TaxID=2767773 RepID=UPI0019513410|nr:hypothetical protein [Halomicronema sp. CCY15110]